MSRSLLFLLALGIFFAPSSISPADSADPQPFFGPRIYSRSPGAPRLESDHFKNCEPAARYRLIVESGAPRRARQQRQDCPQWDRGGRRV